jgi:hypothetical protein
VVVVVVVVGYTLGGVTAMNLIEWHKRSIDWTQRKMGLSDYGMLCLCSMDAFFKGVVLTVIVMKVFF